MTTTTQIHQLPASEIAAAVAKGSLTPTEVVEAFLARIDAVEDRVRAWCYLDRDHVRAQAHTLTEEARAGLLRGPMHGVPVGIKDEFHIKGLPTYMKDRNDPPEPEDATPVARLRAAGAIIMGKTTMPYDRQPPPTRNPWNLEHTAGGTSSGSGAAVAARMVPIALGEQTAGSNLRPAAYCGLAGLKPTFGRISRFGCYPFSYSHDHPGLIGQNCEDIALALSVMAGSDERDPSSLPDPPPPPRLDLAGLMPPRIGLVTNIFPERAEPVMRQALERSASRLRDVGAMVQDVQLPDEFGIVWQVHQVVGGPESTTFHAKRRADRGEAFKLVEPRRVSALIPATYYLHAQRVRRWLHDRMRRFFADCEVAALLMPAAPGAAPKGLSSTGNASLLVPWSCLGFPALTINGGLSPEGLPLGLQFVGAPGSDYPLLHVGAWCENVLGRLPGPEI